METPDNNSESRDLPEVETKTYADGTEATGVAPLPDQSPAEQEVASKTDVTENHAQAVFDDLKKDIMGASAWPQHIVEVFNGIFASHRARL